MNPYPWLHVGEDGSVRADLHDCTSAEMDRRLIIMQEIEAGRVVVAGEVERVKESGRLVAAESYRMMCAYEKAQAEISRLRESLNLIASCKKTIDGDVVDIARKTLTPPAPSHSPPSASPPPPPPA